MKIFVKLSEMNKERHDIRYKDTQPNDTHQNIKNWNIATKDIIIRLYGIIINIVMLISFILSLVMLSVILLNVVALKESFPDSDE